MSYPIISADSRVTEPPNAYIDNIDPAYRDRAPRLGAGDMFVIEGFKVPIPLDIVAAAGKPPEQIQLMGTRLTPRRHPAPGVSESMDSLLGDACADLLDVVATGDASPGSYSSLSRQASSYCERRPWWERSRRRRSGAASGR